MTQSPGDAPTATSSTDVEALSKIIVLPERPVAVVWQRRVLGTPNGAVPGPTDWHLQVLLTFDEEGARRIVAAAQKLPRPRDVGTIENPDWLPAAIQKSLVPAPNSATRHSLKGEVYDASAFARPPLSHGSLVHVAETENFFLSLHTQ